MFLYFGLLDGATSHDDVLTKGSLPLVEAEHSSQQDKQSRLRRAQECYADGSKDVALDAYA